MHEVILARVSRIIELSEGRQLISSAETDRLTGLYTRNFFFEYANRLFTYHPERHRDAIVVDVEQFHTINALNGRDFGDKVLRCIGDSIKSCLEHVEGIAARIEDDCFDIYCTAQDDYAKMLACLQEKVNGLSPFVSIHLRMGVMPWHEGVEPIVMFDRARAACNMARGNFQYPLKVSTGNCSTSVFSTTCKLHATNGSSGWSINPSTTYSVAPHALPALRRSSAGGTQTWA